MYWKAFLRAKNNTTPHPPIQSSPQRRMTLAVFPPLKTSPSYCNLSHLNEAQALSDVGQLPLYWGVPQT